jgi:exopolysaccharide biosynthesis polyprenyl glycosylphosphotransferase
MFTDALIFAFLTFFLASKYSIPKEYIISTTVLFTSCGIYILYLKGYYNIKKYDFGLKDAYLLLEGIILAGIILFAFLLFFDFDKLTSRFIVNEVIFASILMYIWRKFFYYQRKYLKSDSNVLIIGASKTGKIIADEILKTPMLKLNLIGFIDNNEDSSNFDFNGLKIIGTTSKLKEIITEHNIKKIVIAIINSEIDHQTLMDISECVSGGIDIWEMPIFYEKITQKIPVLVITPEWFMYNFTSLERPLYEFLKRIFDIIAAAIILFVTLPIVIIIALSIKLTDGGSIFYFQERVGKNDKQFKMIKLRTMIECAEKDGAVWASNNNKDPRVTSIGRIARKLRFDEIPQMINILKGEMSIVGPRPERHEFVELLNKEIPFYNRRHWVTPGWTGWAQIMYKYGASIEDATEKLRYDFFYIKHRNIFWDFNILMKAVSLALAGRHG